MFKSIISAKMFILFLLLLMTIVGCGTNDQNIPEQNISPKWSSYKQSDINNLIPSASNSSGNYIVCQGTYNSITVAIYNNTMNLLSSCYLGNLTNIKKLAINDKGEAVCVYVDDKNNNYNLNLIYYSPSLGWSIPQTINTNAFFFFNVDASITANGTVILVWVLNNSIYSSSYSTSYGLSTSSIISTIALENYLNFGGIAVADNGEAIVVWSEGDFYGNGNSYKSVYTPSLGWSSPESFRANRVSMKLSKMDSNNNFVMYISDLDGVNYVARMGINSTYIEKAVASGEYFNSVCISINSSGSAFITWKKYNDGVHDDIYGITYSPSLGWSDDKLIIQNVSLAVFNQKNSGIDNYGNLFLAYIQSTNNIPALYIARYSANQSAIEPIIFTKNFYQMLGLDLVVSQMGYALLSWTQQDDINATGNISYMSYYR